MLQGITLNPPSILRITFGLVVLKQGEKTLGDKKVGDKMVGGKMLRYRLPEDIK